MEWIWKLIELLNEYEPYIQSDGTHIDNFWWYVSQWHSAVFPKEVWVERIISKSYWFIEWLVDNDKIDLWKIDEDRLETIQYSEKERITIYDWLLMLLSISNSPIDDLVLYLR